MTRQIYLGFHDGVRGAISGHGIYTLILCEIGHIRLVWCAPSSLLCQSGMEGVAQKSRLKPSRDAQERFAGWGLGIYTPSTF